MTLTLYRFVVIYLATSHKVGYITYLSLKLTLIDLIVHPERNVAIQATTILVFSSAARVQRVFVFVAIWLTTLHLRQ